MQVELNETNINMLNVTDSVNLNVLFEDTNDIKIDYDNPVQTELVTITHDIGLVNNDCWSTFNMSLAPIE